MVAVSETLGIERLVAAYQKGIFMDEDGTGTKLLVLVFSPNRMVLLHLISEFQAKALNTEALK